MLDEIARLVPGYALNRMNLFGGNDVPTEPGFVPVTALTAADSSNGLGTIAASHDGLFTSGTLGEHSQALKELKSHQARYGGLRVL